MAKKAKSPTGRPSKVKEAIKRFDRGDAGGGKRPKAKPAAKKKTPARKKGGTNYRVEDALRRSGA